jgi:hypothetical protein
MHLAGGERPYWPAERRYALHHAIVAGGLADSSWRDGGLTVHDVSDPISPRLLAHGWPATRSAVAGPTWSPAAGRATPR